MKKNLLIIVAVILMIMQVTPSCYAAFPVDAKSGKATLKALPVANSLNEKHSVFQTIKSKLFGKAKPGDGQMSARGQASMICSVISIVCSGLALIMCGFVDPLIWVWLGVIGIAFAYWGVDMSEMGSMAFLGILAWLLAIVVDCLFFYFYYYDFVLYSYY